ncbi:MAG: hypothetical protein H6654_19005 [Ardenticatenaceae bacterium]|nr:hypothetical protein [Anaerolineales bacterium]MCB8938291.1 hypothetical protein [Ardenticatenaceae bacterium]MCB8975656.1 hypothetical protein [Ardenticatenaceae bacterium]
MKRQAYLTLLTAVCLVFVLGIGSVFADGGGNGRTEGPSLEIVGQDSSFSCYFIQPSPCDGITYEVTGKCTIGVRETVLNSREEHVQLGIRFIGQGDGYTLRISHDQVYDAIEGEYFVQGVHYEWDGKGRLPDFESTSSGSVFMSNGLPTGLSLYTTSAQCTP